MSKELRTCNKCNEEFDTKGEQEYPYICDECLSISIRNTDFDYEQFSDADSGL